MPRARTPNPGLLNDFHLLAFDELDSTNEEARRIALKGGAHGAVVWARRQTAGRGRMERVWESREGNLFCSILLAPGRDVAAATQLSFVASLAVREALQPILPEGCDISLKWPNDVLIDGRKAGGILLEAFTPPGEEKLWVVVGIGINVDSYPQDALFPATCIREAGVDLISAKIVLSRLVHHFVTRYNQWQQRGFSAIRREWMRHAWMLRQPVRLCLPGEEIQGVFDSVDDGGSLVLKLERGRRQVIPAGDMFSLRALEEAAR